MSGTKNPHATVFWNDIEHDECLKACSYAAAGLWLRHLLPIAARSREYGVILQGNSPCRYDDDLPRVLANTVPGGIELITAMLKEIVDTGTASIDDDGRLINRRMVRDRLLSEERSKAGKAGAEARWQTDGKHHGKRDGKSSDGHEDVNTSKQREIPGLSPDARCEGDGKPMHSSLLHASYEEGDISTEERFTAPAGAGADERGEPKSGSKAGSRKARAEARGTRVPDGWQPSSEAAQFARDLDLNPETVTAEFIDHWRGVPGVKGRKLDWDATYRNRCRALAERRSSNGTRQRTGTSRPQTVSGTQARNRAAFGAALNRLRDRGSDGGGDRDRRQEGDDARDVEATVLEPGQGPARAGEEGA